METNRRLRIEGLDAFAMGWDAGDAIGRLMRLCAGNFDFERGIGLVPMLRIIQAKGNRNNY